MAILQSQGYTDVSAVLCETTPVADIKAILVASPHSLFIVGGAMMQGFPELMADLLDYVSKTCPTIRVHKTTKADFDDGIEWPPSEEMVNKSALNICTRLLEEAEL